VSLPPAPARALIAYGETALPFVPGALVLAAWLTIAGVALCLTVAAGHPLRHGMPGGHTLDAVRARHLTTGLLLLWGGVVLGLAASASAAAAALPDSNLSVLAPVLLIAAVLSHCEAEWLERADGDSVGMPRPEAASEQARYTTAGQNVRIRGVLFAWMGICSLAAAILG
jgi:hypothetical protein